MGKIRGNREEGRLTVERSATEEIATNAVLNAFIVLKITIYLVL